MDSSRESQSGPSIDDQFEDLERTFKTLPVGLVSFDRDLRYIRANDQLAEYLGTPVDVLIGKTVREAVPEMASYFEETYRPIFETGEPILRTEVRGSAMGHPDPEPAQLHCRKRDPPLFSLHDPPAKAWQRQ